MRRTLVAIAAGLTLGALVVGVNEVMHGEAPAPRAPAFRPRPSAEPSKFPLCEELHAIFDRARVAQHCPADGWHAIKEICEMPYLNGSACVDELRVVVTCLGGLPSSSWTCEDGVASANGTACPQVAAFTGCLDRSAKKP